MNFDFSRCNYIGLNIMISFQYKNFLGDTDTTPKEMGTL